MRILEFVPNLSGGGAERLVVDLCNQLVKEHEVTLLTLYDPTEDDLFRGQVSPNIESKSLGKRLGFDWKVVIKLYKSIQDTSPDIIHNHLRSLNYLIPSLLFKTNVPVIHTIHNNAFKECPSKLVRGIRKLFFKRGKVLPITISEESADSFERVYGSMNNELIHNGRKYPEKSDQFNVVIQELKGYKCTADTKLFVTIGRVIPQKNQLILVEAFNRLIYKDRVDAHLLLIGGGRNTESSREIQKQLQKAEKEHDHIHLLGERANATDYLHAADFFCLSSLYEGMPITLIEAFATGTIPICTPVGGIPEMVSELDSLLLSESTDEDDYYEALKRAYFLEDEKQGEFKKRAKALFEERYSIECCAEKYENLFKKVI